MSLDDVSAWTSTGILMRNHCIGECWPEIDDHEILDTRPLIASQRLTVSSRRRALDRLTTNARN